MKKHISKREEKQIMKTTLHFDRDLHKRVRIAAIEEDTSMTALIEKAVEEYLGKRRKGGK